MAQQDHPEGFSHDLPRLIARRDLLRLTGFAGAAMLAPGLARAACVAMPSETAGPFPGDGTVPRDGTINVLGETGVLRGDLRDSFAGLSGHAKGVRLDLRLQLVSASDGCTPLPGRAVYLWHCDADGAYSLYNIADQNYLRGVAVSDANGVVQATTIFPGCYPGRWPHIHFEVFDSPETAVTGKQAVLTSQFAFPVDACAQVYDQDAAYRGSQRPFARQTFAQDRIFADGSDAQKAQQMAKISYGADGNMTAELLIGLA